MVGRANNPVLSKGNSRQPDTQQMCKEGFGVAARCADHKGLLGPPDKAINQSQADI